MSYQFDDSQIFPLKHSSVKLRSKRIYLYARSQPGNPSEYLQTRPQASQMVESCRPQGYCVQNVVIKKGSVPGRVYDFLRSDQLQGHDLEASVSKWPKLRRTVNKARRKQTHCQQESTFTPIAINAKKLQFPAANRDVKVAKDMDTRQRVLTAVSSTRKQTKSRGKSISIGIKPQFFEQPQKMVDPKSSKYREFVLKLQFAHGVIADSKLPYSIVMPKPKAFIAFGNNSAIVKTALKNRFWWQLSSSPTDASFLWTQNKNALYHSQQKVCLFEPQAQAPGLCSQGEAKLLSKQDYRLLKESGLGSQNKLQLQKKKNLRQVQRRGWLTHNHLPSNQLLGDKRWLILGLQRYCRLKGISNQYTPKTIVITQELKYETVIKELNLSGEQLWILKPGQNSNRGQGIKVVRSEDQVFKILSKKGWPSYVLQKYIQKPLLYQRRKFDIRHFMLVTCLHGVMKAYWSEEGYVRTASAQFSKQADSRAVHLTNDAVQRKMQHYGEHEPANKLSYDQIARWIGPQFESRVLRQMQTIGKEVVNSVYFEFGAKKLQHNFELFGLDFLLDQDLRPWLLEVNTNPCLECPCPLLKRLLPHLVEHVLQLSIDVLFPPPLHFPRTQQHLVPEVSLETVPFRLIFDQQSEGASLRQLFRGQTHFQT